MTRPTLGYVPLARPSAIIRQVTPDVRADYYGTLVPVTVPASVTVNVGDLVILDRVRQTLRVSQVIGTGY